MGIVFADQSMSLDGFTAEANVGPDNEILLGASTSMFSGLDGVALERTRLVDTDAGVTHITFGVGKPR